jgi:hypothetical protein
MSDPNAHVFRGWKPSPDGRGTIDILHNCLFTIFICCWSALHMNVPADDDSFFTILMRRVKWMLVMLLVPELVGANAMSELGAATLLKRHLHTKWKEHPQLSKWTMTHCFFLTMGGISLQTKAGQRFNPSVPHFIALLENDELEIPDLSLKDIKDRSKADWLIKAIWVSQIIWFAIQIIGRASQHLPIATIEIFTLASVSSAICTYFIWWSKPYNVMQSMPFKTTATLEALDDAKSGWMYNGDVLPGNRRSLDDDFGGKFEIKWLGCSAVLFICLVFGGLHTIGWDNFFDTRVELLLWRISSIACAVIPICIAMVGALGRFAFPVGVLLSVLYTLLRIYLVVEAFAGLRAVPPAVYESVSWPNFVPHI